MANARILSPGAFGTGQDIKTVTVLAAPPAGARFKTATQATAATPGNAPSYMLGPTGAVGLKTIVIPGFTGPV